MCPTDADVVEWIQGHASKKPEEIAAFNDEIVKLAPTNDSGREFLKRLVAQLDPTRTDKVTTWFEVMELDDRITFERLYTGE